MPVFAYKTLDASGRNQSDQIEAGTEEQARALLRSRGVPVVKLKLVSSGATEQGPARATRGRGRVTVDDLAVVFRQLAVMIRAGIPVSDALDGLAEQAKVPALRHALATVRQDVLGGASITDAFRAHPAVFPSLAADMIAVAEAGGTLSEALERLASHVEGTADIQRKVKAAMTYPMVVVAIAILTLISLLTFILPRFLTLFEQMNVELPLTTKLLMALSDSTRHQWYLWIGAIAAGVHGTKRFMRSSTGRARVDRALLTAPVIGDLYSKIVTTRVLTTLGTLLNAGVPAISALETAATAANNAVVEAALRETQTDIASGATLSGSLKKGNVFPALVIQVVAAGEKTGELPEMLAFACDYYAKEVEAKLKSLTSIIEPVLIVGLGALVGFIAVSIILPIYSIVGGVK